jgi:hypothetical protein
MAPQKKKYHVFEELDVLSGVIELGKSFILVQKGTKNLTLF